MRGTAATCATSEGMMTLPRDCADGHVWTRGDVSEPPRGTPCDCGQKLWGVTQHVVREHQWEFYFNGSFCRRCGASIGSGVPCR